MVVEIPFPLLPAHDAGPPPSLDRWWLPPSYAALLVVAAGVTARVLACLHA